MSSYASINLRGVEIFSWRNEIDPVFLFLFSSQEVDRTPQVPDNFYDLPEVVRLTAPVSVLRDRLAVLGIGREVLESSFREVVDYRLRLAQGPFQISGLDEDRVEQLKHVTLSAWADLLAEAIASRRNGGSDDRRNPASLSSLLELWEDSDARLMLAAVLLACGDDDEVAFDITALIQAGWIDRDFDPQTAAIEHFSYSLVNGSPPVVITEGSTDAQFLQAAVRIRYPHLQAYIKFFDFADGAEGSASAGVRTLKSFAAAGISNRVVLLLDNDAAARDALRALRGSNLPRHYSVLHYPDIDLARSYPTLGPSGLSEMDVNGLAGSMS